MRILPHIHTNPAAHRRLMWAAEVERWLPRLQPADLLLIRSKDDKLRAGAHRPKVVITSYSMLRNLSHTGDMFASSVEPAWGVVIADESHCLTGTSNKSNRAVEVNVFRVLLSLFPHHNPRVVISESFRAWCVVLVQVLRRAKRLVLLTGTPAVNKPYSIWTQINCVRPELLGSQFDFGSAYCDPRYVPNPFVDKRVKQKEFNGAGYAKELKLLLDTVRLRRTKEEVRSELPPLLRTFVHLDVDDVSHGSEGHHDDIAYHYPFSPLLDAT